MKIKGVIEDLKFKKKLKNKRKRGKKKKKRKRGEKKKKKKKKRMIVKIVKIYLGFSLVLLWAVWGQFIFG